MKNINLSFVANAVNGELFGDDGTTEIENIFTDSRVDTQNGLFVALKGENFDGNDFAESLLESGKAVCALCSRKIDTEKPYILVDDTKQALGTLARKYRESLGVRVVGITGSVGKTTTKDMTALVLSKRYVTVKTQGNHNNDIGLPLTVFDIDERTDRAVIEMGMNHFGEISYLTKIARPDVSIITKIGVSHIENLGSRENIMKAKLEILDGMNRTSPLILNGDDDLLSRYTDMNRPVYFFGIDNKNCDAYAENIITDDNGQSFDIVYRNEKYHAHLCVDGVHNVYDALSAFLVGVLDGVEPEKCCEALSQFTPTGFRQKKETIGGVTFIEDCYNASPDSVKANLLTLKNTKGRRKFACLGDMLELGEKSDRMHTDIGDVCGQLELDGVFCFGEKSKAICETAKNYGIKKCFHSLDKQAVARELLNTLDDGDVVLVKGSRGMKMEEIIEFIRKEI